MNAPFPCHPIPAVAAEIEADAALAMRAQKLGLGLARRLATPETAETIAHPVARDVCISDTNPDGPHPGKFWLDIIMTDGRHLSAILLPEQLARLVRQAEGCR